MKEGTKHQKYIIWIALGVIVGVALYYVIHYFSGTAVFRRMGTFSNEESNDTRIRYYIEAWEDFCDHPLFGLGFHQTGGGLGGHTHSTYAESIACFGFVGCVIYYTPLLYTLFCVLKRSFYGKSFHMRMILVLCVTEFFLGVGTIFFYEMFHFLSWVIIFTCYHLHMMESDQDSRIMSAETKGRCKYVRYEK